MIMRLSIFEEYLSLSSSILNKTFSLLKMFGLPSIGDLLSTIPGVVSGAGKSVSDLLSTIPSVIVDTGASIGGMLATIPTKGASIIKDVTTTIGSGFAEVSGMMVDQTVGKGTGYARDVIDDLGKNPLVASTALTLSGTTLALGIAAAIGSVWVLKRL